VGGGVVWGKKFIKKY